MTFPPGFVFGLATSAYQIEGATGEDDRAPSVWDTFCEVPGAVFHGDDGTVACDHYHRAESDLDLLAELRVPAYRFSISWPRVLPDGSRTVSQKGLDFYRRLLDGLATRGIEPLVTLYHWDLPQAHQDVGGWANRDTVHYFCDYAGAVLDALGDMVPRWVTINEPFCAAMLGYLEGRHAPGVTDLHSALAASHHLLLAHGEVLGIIRAAAPQAEVGITHLLSDITPASASGEDQAAASRLDGYENRWFLSPVLTGSYPQDMLDWYGQRTPLDFIRDDDLRVIAAPTDFLGVNYYVTKTVRADPAEPHHQAADVPGTGALTATGLDVRPAGLGRMLRRVGGLTRLPLYITENGAAFHDYVDPRGEVNDTERVAYLEDHLREVLAAIGDGTDVRGYFGWSFLDNFEWAEGYSKRFGLVYVDFGTQARIPKSSARWFSRLIAQQRAGGD